MSIQILHINGESLSEGTIQIIREDGSLKMAGGGSGGSLLLEVDGIPNGSQTLLNLVSGSGISIIDDGVGNVTIETSGNIDGGSATAIYLISQILDGGNS